MSIDQHRGKAASSGSSLRSRLVLMGAMLLLVVVFAGLGSWQVQRLFWKLDLIARVDARVQTQAVPAPSRAEWEAVGAQKDEYRRVTVTGDFEHDKTVLVQAVTERGAGFWVLTPMRRQDGSTVLINRGFVPADRRDASDRAQGNIAGAVEVTGLLRMSEPGGAFLRSNDPANDRWFSRDVAAIAASKGLADVAPYFVDADATPVPGGLPIGGLTNVRFRNSHLVYALTWYALAMMSTAGASLVYFRRAA
ncbi:SURF1 family protein [Rhizobium giardinii]|uniref:SURF1-like protein n=1 Tax=Rhizobium giardinii TaxID=56731 RepID=A0A7W8UGD8_9HYPH|nr:SURF1 family protein [Rhizobium giardinii]MBB5538891.1 surfeit locus 1 family protein [Rhizobium giardinii]